MSASVDAAPPASWRVLRRRFDHCGGLDTSCVLHVAIDRQRVFLLSPDDRSNCYPVSTSKFGHGCREGSYQTPLGLHAIAEKVGAGAASGTVFKGRQAIGAVSADAGPDPITSRILWLRGLETGINSGAGVDTYARYIYIHGTPHEADIGQPASVGCIRMRNADVIELFDRVATGTPVLISASGRES